MKHLVLGSGGQIGFHLVSYLKSIGEEVIRFDIVEKKEQDLRVYNNLLLENVIKECDFVHFLAYGILKAIGEKYTKSLKGLVVKFWNVYGYEKDEEKSHVITDFIKMAQLGKIKMRTTGTELRQFLYGDDCADCLFKLSKYYNEVDRDEELHITNFKWTSIQDIATIIQEEINCKIIPGIKEDNVQKGKINEPNNYIYKYWKPKTTIKNGIKEIIK